MSWCEKNRVGYVFGLAKNERLVKKLRKRRRSGRRRGKAEYLAKGENPSFVVASVPIEEMDARSLYEDFYCARGEIENRIKEQPLDLFADRTSTSWLHSNQIRLYLSSLAYCVVSALRRLLWWAPTWPGRSVGRSACGC
jgi:hypothetical protein